MEICGRKHEGSRYDKLRKNTGNQINNTGKIQLARKIQEHLIELATAVPRGGKNIKKYTRTAKQSANKTREGCIEILTD